MGWNHSLSPPYTKDQGQQTQWPNRIDGMESFTIPTVYNGSWTTDSVAEQNRWDGIIHYPHCIQRIMDNRLSGQTEQMGWNHSLSPPYTKDQGQQTQWPNRIDGMESFTTPLYIKDQGQQTQWPNRTDGMESFTIPIVYKGSRTTDSVAKQNRWDGIIHYPHRIQRIKDNRLSGRTE